MIDSTQKPLSEFGSVSGVKPSILGQLKQAASGDLKAEMSSFGEGVTAEYQSECNIMKGKECSDCSQDISQISGPDGKSKPTPISQIGFRDPASLGGGQQLTLLSIEVLEKIFLLLLSCLVFLQNAFMDDIGLFLLNYEMYLSNSICILFSFLEPEFYHNARSPIVPKSLSC